MKFSHSIIAHILVFVASVSAFARSRPLPEIPVPKTSAVDAIRIAREHIDDGNSPTLVSVDWVQASAFEPRINDGSGYSVGGDDPDGWSWFLTFVPQRDRNAQLIVVRVKDDGSIGRFNGIRT